MPKEPIYILTKETSLFSNTLIKESHYPYKPISLNETLSEQGLFNMKEEEQERGGIFFGNEIEKYLHSEFDKDTTRFQWGIDLMYESQLFNEYDQKEFFNKFLVGAGFENSFVSCYTSYFTDQELADDPAYRGKKWNGFAGGPEQVLVAFQPLENPYFCFKLGHDYLGWAEGLLMSVSHRPFDYFSVEAGNENIRFIGFTAILDKIYLSDSLQDEFNVRWVPRFLGGHRILLSYKNIVTVGLSELVLYGGPYREIEPGYFLPFYWFHSEQLNSKFDDNTFWGMDFKLQFRSSLFFGEFVLDDIQIEHEVQSDEEPAEYGLKVGFTQGLIIHDNFFSIGCNYTRVSNRTYNQKIIWNKYVNGDDLLGCDMGNDFDKLSFWCRYWWTSSLPVQLHFDYIRQGEGNVFDEWSEPWMEAGGEYQEDFPSGIVQESSVIGLATEKWFGRFIDAFFKIDWMNVENYNHQTNVNENFLNLKFAVTVRYSRFRWN
ncbi:hypothetical protein JXI42_06870 [bacterium]|nr:hypothetical protein [bacterium]